MSIATLYLQKNADRRLHAGHLWVYSNEIDNARSPLKDFSPGQPVRLCAADGSVLANAYVNPHSLICARIFSRDPHFALDRSLLVHRFNIALSLRERCFKQPYYRLVYGDSDGLPGLVIDRYGEVVVVQIGTAGMELVREEIIAALDKVLKPRAIVFKNESSVRALEGLTNYVEVVAGTLPDPLWLEENGVRFQISVLEGQKTGWFYDHRMNRQRLATYVPGQRVLDVFSYAGAWGIQAAVAGASSVLCLDSSATALAAVQANAAANGVAERVQIQQGDAFDTLKALRQAETRFDVIVVDPPAFIKRRKDQRSGEQAYRRINQMAMQLLEKDGILVAASCSLHLSRAEFIKILNAAARHLDRELQIIEQGGQGPDHPIHPAIPETDYLKAVFCRLLKNPSRRREPEAPAVDATDSD